MPTSWSDWVRQVLAVAAKELKAEWRTRHALVALVTFAGVCLCVVSFALVEAITDGLRVQAEGWGGLLWIILFFAALSGLPRTFVREEDTKTAAALRLTASPTAVYVGKLLFNLALMAALEVVVVPLFIILMGVKLKSVHLLIASVTLGTLGLSASGTMLSAMISKATTRAALFGVVAFPMMLPVLLPAISATAAAFGSIANPLGELQIPWGDLKVMLSYTVVIFTASLMLFESVWRSG